MSILGWIQRVRDGKVIGRHVERIVTRYVGVVREASIARAAGMPRAEARGYVRVKALALVAPVVEQKDAHGQAVPARLQGIIATLATERLVVEIMRQLSHGIAQPAPKRKAA